MQQTRISLIIQQKRGVTADTAMQLSGFFGTTLEFWMNLQREHDLRKAKAEIGDSIERIVPLAM